MGYGGLPNFTEYDPSGHVLLDGTLGKNVQDFRTYLAPWSGQAPGAPSVVGQRPARARRVAVSWNGATNVASWQVLGGRLGDDARAGREGREGRLPDDDRGAAPPVPTSPCRRSTPAARCSAPRNGQGLAAGRPPPTVRARSPMSVIRRPLIVRSLSAGFVATLGVAALAAGCAGASGGGSGQRLPAGTALPPRRSPRLTRARPLRAACRRR